MSHSILPCPADQIKALFPNLYGKPNAHIVADSQAKGELHTESVKIGVVLSGGQAPGGHNVISGLFGKCRAFRSLWFRVCCQVLSLFGFPSAVKCSAPFLRESIVQLVEALVINVSP
jgi:hypothetical protein